MAAVAENKGITPEKLEARIARQPVAESCFTSQSLGDEARPLAESRLTQQSLRNETRPDEGSPSHTHFTIHIDLGRGLTHRERVILYNSARRCEVYQLLTGEMTFEYELLEVDGPADSNSKRGP